MKVLGVIVIGAVAVLVAVNRTAVVRFYELFQADREAMRH